MSGVRRVNQDFPPASVESLHQRHAQLLDDSNQRHVRSLDRGNRPLESERLNAMFEDRPGCFGRQSLAPMLWCESPADPRGVI